jgi:hypothetical protein
MITPQLEKVFFNYILLNKKYYEVVETYFFKNSEIQFVYGIIRKYILESTEKKTPSRRQILDMVSSEDRDSIITKEILKSILTVDLSEYNEKDFILPKFNAWILANRIKTGAVDIIEETRSLDNDSDFEKTIQRIDKIKSIVKEMSSVNFIQDDNLGSDFDEPGSHVQDSSKFKVKCGYETIDHMLGGGWDVQTLNCIMAETNNGKCTSYNTKIKIRDKNTKITLLGNIGEIFENIANSSK